MISYYKKTTKDKKLKKLDEFEKGCWVNVSSATHKDLAFLEEKFKLDKDNLNSGLDPHEIPRADFVGGDVYLFIKIPPKDIEKNVSTFLIVITKNFILTLSKHNLNFVKELIKDNLNQFHTNQKTSFLLHILSINNSVFERRTLDIVKSIETKRNITDKLTTKDINNFIEYEYILNNFVSSYSYTNFMYNKIIHRLGFLEKDKDILEELIIDTEEGENICKTSLKNISNIRNYSMILLTSKLNRLISILTVLTVFLSVIASISSVYGMNIKLPLQTDENAFLYVVAFVAVTWLGFVLYLKRNRVI